MREPFIRNHQYNAIKKQADTVLNAYRTVSDPKILEAVRLSALAKVNELFPAIASDQRTSLSFIADIRTAEDHKRYIRELEPYMDSFPAISEKQMEKLFKSVKKLKLPELAAIDFRYVSYLSWIDISSNRKFIVYHTGGKFVGIEGRITPLTKKSCCFVCNQYGELGLFSVITKNKPANASPDYYKSVGNYICMDSHACNQNITDAAPLDLFIHAAFG